MAGDGDYDDELREHPLYSNFHDKNLQVLGYSFY